MIFTNIIAEYIAVQDTLAIANDFFIKAQDMVKFYTNQYMNITTQYYNSTSSTPKDSLVNNLNSLTSELFARTTSINSRTRNLYKCIGILPKTEISNPVLSQEIDSLIKYADSSVDNICEIIEVQLSNARKNNLFSKLIENLIGFVTSYSNIQRITDHINGINKLLYEPLPEKIAENDTYTDFVINSLVQTVEFNQIYSSIKCFDELCDGVNRLIGIPSYEKYYIRRIESGSLVITITGLTTSLIALGKFIDFCFKRYIEYQKMGLEIKSMRQQIITTDLSIAEKILEISPDLENKTELLEKASNSAFTYFKFNPKFKIGDVTYDTGENVQLIESKMTK